MRTITLFRSAACLIGLAASCTAAPIIQSVQFNSVVLGNTTTLQASITDTNGSLTGAFFNVSGPAARNYANLGAVTWPVATSAGLVTITVTATGWQTSASWTPNQVGTYSVTVQVTDNAGQSATQTGTIECISGRLVVPKMTFPSGTDTIYTYNGEIATSENDTGPGVVVNGTGPQGAPGGSLILWSGGRVDLKPGFHAIQNSFFWAAVDHNMDGYSDVEEATCTSGDNIPDAWKVDHGLSIGTNYSSQPIYLAAYLAGANAMLIVPPAMPSGSSVKHAVYSYDNDGQLKTDPDRAYAPDAEGNVQ